MGLTRGKRQLTLDGTKNKRGKGTKLGDTVEKKIKRRPSIGWRNRGGTEKKKGNPRLVHEIGGRKSARGGSNPMNRRGKEQQKREWYREGACKPVK